MRRETREERDKDLETKYVIPNSLNILSKLEFLELLKLYLELKRFNFTSNYYINNNLPPKTFFTSNKNATCNVWVRHIAPGLSLATWYLNGEG